MRNSTWNLIRSNISEIQKLFPLNYRDAFVIEYTQRILLDSNGGRALRMYCLINHIIPISLP